MPACVVAHLGGVTRDILQHVFHAHFFRVHVFRRGRLSRLEDFSAELDKVMNGLARLRGPDISFADYLSRRRRHTSMLMIGKRILAKCYAQTIAKLFVHLVENRMKHSARRTLEITKLFQVYRGVRWSNRVGRLCSGDASVDDWLLSRRRLRAWGRRGRRLSGRRTRRYWSRQIPGAAQSRTKNHENDDERKYSFHILSS